MSSMFETFGGNPIQPAYPGGFNLSLTGNIQLAWPVQFQNTANIVYNFMNVTPTGNGFIITMPDATLASAFQSVIFNNPSAFSFIIHDFAGNLLFNSAAGTARYLILTDNSTQAGTWLSFPFVAGGSAVTSINMTSSSPDVVIGGVPITAAGTITLALAQDLLALTSFAAGTGIACHTAANTWALRQVIGTNNQIAVANQAGVAGNITVSLSPNILGISSMEVGDIQLGILGPTVISTQNTNENLDLEPNGTGLVVIGGGGLSISAGAPVFFFGDNATNYLSIEGGSQTVNYGLIWPTVAPLDGQVLGVGIPVGGVAPLQWLNVTTFGGPSTINAIAKFSTTFGTLENSLVLLDNVGNLSNINSAQILNLQIGGTGGALPNTIESINANGNIYLTCNGSGEVSVNGPLGIYNQSPLRFYSGGGNYVSLQVPPLAQVVNYTIPSTVPFLSQVWITNTNGTPATFVNSYLSSNPNILDNGGFNIWQRGTSFISTTPLYPNNNLQYCADRWKLLSNGNNIASVSQVTATIGTSLIASSSNAWQFTVTTGGAKFGICQIVSAVKSVNLQNNQVVFSVTAQGVGTTAMKFAVLGWTGAADAPTTDPISAWNATGTKPTLVANWVYQAEPISVVLTGNYTTYTTGSIPIGNTVNNVAVFVWCDSTTGVGGNSMAITCCNLTAGPNFLPFYPDIPSLELLKCKRTFQKDFPYAIAPRTLTTLSSKSIFTISQTAVGNVTIANNTSYGSVSYEVELTSSVAPTIYLYSYVNGTQNIATTFLLAGPTFYTDDGANSATLTAGATSDTKGFRISNTSGGNVTTQNYVVVHWTVTADF